MTPCLSPVRAVFAAQILWTLAGFAARAQALPADTPPPSQGFRLPRAQGDISYSLTSSERVTFDYNGNGSTVSAADLGESFAYLSASSTHPFSVVETGGYLIDTYGQPSTFFDNLAVSQVYSTRNWTFVLADGFSDLPETPTLGLSGLAGVGDLGLAPVGSSGDPTQGGLTGYVNRLDERVAGSVTPHITGRTSLEASGSYAIERFPGSSGEAALGNNQVNTTFGVDHRFSARRAVAGNYSLSQFSYVGLEGDFFTQSVELTYQELITRKLSIDLSAGPQRTGASQLTGQGASWNYVADAKANYTGYRNTLAASYTRRATAGYGITLGARNDTFRVDLSHRVNQSFSVAGSFAYAHNTGLHLLSTTVLTTSSEVASVQANRAINRKLSGFLSFSGQRQADQGVSQGLTLFSGLSYVLGFGLTYAPGDHPLRH